MGNKSRSNPDWSTIDIDRLRALRVYELPTYYHTQDEPGNGCAGDPPGYPTYFTRNIYTSAGNSPECGPQMVITFEGRHYIVDHSSDWDGVKGWDEYSAKRDARLRSLWKPLSIDHERTRLWMQGTYAHQQHMYLDEAGSYQREGDTSYSKRWNSFVFPVPSYKLEHFRDDPRLSEEWRSTEKANKERKNAETIALATQIATPENHCAVRIIRRYYPEHQPIMDWITGAAPPPPGNWWETAAKQPKPENCPGQYDHKHPVNGSWCQWCGWREAEAASAA